MLDKKGQLGVWLFFAFIVLIIAVSLLFIFLHGREPVKVVPLNVTNVTLYNVSIVLSNVIGLPVSYVLSNISFDVRGGFDGSSCINVSNLYVQGYIGNGSDSMGCPLVGKWMRGKAFISGLFFPDKVEFYRGGVVANSTILLEAFSDAYYFNSTVCNISRELFSCKLSLLKKANDYTLSFNESFLFVNFTDGFLQKPLICESHDFCLWSIVVGNLSSVKVPDDLHWKFDTCFNVSRDLSNFTIFPLIFHRSEFVNCSSNVSFLLRDFEIVGHQNVGDAIARSG
jgi:hypothetical protein